MANEHAVLIGLDRCAELFDEFVVIHRVRNVPASVVGIVPTTDLRAPGGAVG